MSGPPGGAAPHALVLLVSLLLLTPQATAAIGDDGCAGGADASDTLANATLVEGEVTCDAEVHVDLDLRDYYRHAGFNASQAGHLEIAVTLCNNSNATMYFAMGIHDVYFGLTDQQLDQYEKTVNATACLTFAGDTEAVHIHDFRVRVRGDSADIAGFRQHNLTFADPDLP